MHTYNITDGLKTFLENKDESFKEEEVMQLVRSTASLFKIVPQGWLRAKEVHDQIELALEHDRKNGGEKITCKKGCAHCCHQLVFITEDEAERLAKRAKVLLTKQQDLENNPDEKDKNKLHFTYETLKNQLERQKELKEDMWGWWMSPDNMSKCVFLGKDNQCVVYNQRPSSCRLFMSTSEPFRCSKEHSRKGGTMERHIDINGEIVSSASSNIQSC